ncbi:hypothetical protein [Metabacillus arenae]|uniref:DUF3800 domain-containing protein n=1 Tax=Metabacillus arenae TaxID=2771434 RepID=A0A926S346_9BACI|nr:hypothetical protein [Metabacillus arenae]MBD1382609.1 hypothetical protein [Metabacillus arenae]
MNNIPYACIDEIGDYGLDFDEKDVSRNFIIVVLLVKGDDKQPLEIGLEKIKYFQKEEVNSNTDQRRIEILNQLKDLPFYVDAYVIDKTRIREELGVRNKEQFIHFLTRFLYDHLHGAFEELDLSANDNKEFLGEFKKFVEKNSIRDLFDYTPFGFTESGSDKILKLANFIAGSFDTSNDKTQIAENNKEFLKILKSKINKMNYWPLDYGTFNYDFENDPNVSEMDKLIARKSIDLACDYIRVHNKNPEIDERDRVDFIKFLLFKLKENQREYVYTEEILANLNAIRKRKMQIHYFRSNIVSKLRDQGLLIASSNKGYKLPTSIEDLYDFVGLTSLNIHPMIERISKCRDQILLTTNKKIDILDREEYMDLKQIVDMNKGLIES